jgi:hypothetical protein
VQVTEIHNVFVQSFGSSQLWDTGLHIDGSNQNLAGSRGVRETKVSMLEIGDCQSHSMILNQAVHFHGSYIHVYQGVSNKSATVLICNFAENITLTGCVIEAALSVMPPSTPPEHNDQLRTMNFDGHFSFIDIQDSMVRGTGSFGTSFQIQSRAQNFIIRSNKSPAVLLRCIEDSNHVGRTGDGTPYTVPFNYSAGSPAVIQPIIDVNTDLPSNPDQPYTYFEANVAGLYRLAASITLRGITSSHTQAVIDINVLNNVNQSTALTFESLCHDYNCSSSSFLTLHVEGIAYLLKGQQVQVVVRVGPTTAPKVVWIYGGTTTNFMTTLVG